MTSPINRLAALRARYSHELVLVWRYYYVGLVNAGFGYGTYSLLIFLGLNLFAAQIISYIAGVCFNYFSVTRHVFRDHRGSFVSFIGAYVVNYFVNLGLLYLFHLFCGPYAAGFLAVVGASIVNFFVLKHFTFRRAREQT